MVGRVPYSRAHFWQTILVSFLLVVFNPPSCTAEALVADEAAANEDKREAPAAVSAAEDAVPGGKTALNVFRIRITLLLRSDYGYQKNCNYIFYAIDELTDEDWLALLSQENRFKRGPSPRDLFKSAYSNFYE